MDIDLNEARARRAMKGQILIIFALMIVVILAFAGMAIDLAQARSTSEDLQRAAEAGALAGVVYLPDNPANAMADASAVSTANGVTDNCTASSTCNSVGAIQVSFGPDNGQPDGPTRTLVVTIAKRVPTTFLKVLGISSISVGRSATATYADPIELGAPDHVLGFAPYPTHAVQLCSGTHTLPGAANHCQSDYPYAQGFYLNLNGPYAGMEQGDAFSPYFSEQHGTSTTDLDAIADSANNAITLNMNQSTCTVSTAPATPNDPPITQCKDTSNALHTLHSNPYYDQQNPSSDTVPGYNFVYTVPSFNKPVLLKILDPFDECNTVTSNLSSLTTKVYGAAGPSYGTSPATPQQVSTNQIDYCGGGYWSSASGSAIAGPDTSLRFTIFLPTDQLASAAKTAQAPSGTYSGSSASSGGYTLITPAAAVGGNGQTFGQDPGVGSSTKVYHGFDWFSYGQFTNNSGRTLYIRVNVQAVANAGQAGTTTAYGADGNSFAFGMCKPDSTTSDLGNANNNAEFIAASNNGTLSSTDGTVVSTNGTATGVDAGCADPNLVTTTSGTPDGYGCNPNNVSPAPAINCYKITAINAFCISAYLQSGYAVVPLAEIDQHFANSDITLRLYDAGDVNTGSSVTLNVLGPDDDPSPGTNGDTNPVKFEGVSLDLASPTGSGYSKAGYGRSSSGANSWWFASNCPADYNAFDHQNFDGSVCPPLSALDAGNGNTTGVNPADSSVSPNNLFGNDTWSDFHIHIPATYAPDSANDWWKILYKSSGTHDTTTWEVQSGAAPAHLVSVS